MVYHLRFMCFILPVFSRKIKRKLFLLEFTLETRRKFLFSSEFTLENRRKFLFAPETYMFKTCLPRSSAEWLSQNLRQLKHPALPVISFISE